MTVAHTYADIEQMLIGWVPSIINPCRTVTETSNDLATVLATMPVVRITRIGGSSLLGLDNPLVDFDCFGIGPNPATPAGGRPIAKALAIQLASAVELQLPGYFNQYGTVNAAVMVSGPSARPWENTKIRRFGFSARLTVHTRT